MKSEGESKYEMEDRQENVLSPPSEKQFDLHRGARGEGGEKALEPFTFGTRYLTETDDPFQYNAWDNAEVDDEYLAYAEEQYEKQRSNPVSDSDKHRYNSDPSKWWDQFYKNNTANFFKNRKWLHHEFPVLQEITDPEYGPVTILEVGAGAGNTAFPVLSKNNNPKLVIHAVDFSSKAIEVIRENEAYDGKHIRANVWDVTSTELPEGLDEGSVDIVIMVFIFSALAPTQWSAAIGNIYRLLKPGGQVLFRDYGRGDMAQVRFRKGRYLEENFYVRGDGTRVYFFELEELKSIWGDWKVPSLQKQETMQESAVDNLDETGFEVVKIAPDRRMIVNRHRRIKMHRCWLQAKFVRK